MSYRPKEPFTVAMKLLVPISTVVSGVPKKTFPDDGDLIFGSFKTYGGTERDVNGLYSIEDTAQIETWYRPDIKSDCRIKLESGATYEIINEPENIEMRNQFMKFKVRRVKGGV
ncbi:hypothetical protein [Priestia megaterium]|uniref:hypothetical protein n=1 Tax=Priestia megaterium TaxID=1404 RepID=UPI002E232944|nr:head-tail adaptor protein [Priestia megaterium]